MATSTVYCPTTDIGSTMRIAINKADSSYWHTLSYTFGKYSGNITTGTSATHFDWVVPTGFYTEIPNAKSGTGTITCTTYNSNSQVVGTDTATFTATCNEALCKPTINPTIVDQDGADYAQLTGDSNTIILNLSWVDVTIGATARNSATIVSQKVENGNQAITAASGVIKYPTTPIFTFTVTDSRGFTTVQQVEVPYVPYFKPTVYFSKEFKIVGSTSGNGTGTAEIKGTFYNASFGKTQNKLTLGYYISPAMTGGGTSSNLISITPTINGNEFTASIELSGFEAGKTYELRLRGSDSVSSISEKSKVATPVPIFNWGNQDFSFGVDVDIDGQLDVDDIVLKNMGRMVVSSEEGSGSGGIYLSDGSTVSSILSIKDTGEVSLYSRNDGDLTIKSPNGVINMEAIEDINITAGEAITVENTVGDIWFSSAEDFTVDAANSIYLRDPTYIQGDHIEMGSWSPKAYSFTRSSYRGRYIRFGDVCIVSWYLYGTASSYSDEFCIYNLPFAPDTSYNWPGSGGGNLSGHYADEGYAFCGYTMHDDGDIYARVAGVATEDGQNRTSDYAGQNSGQKIYSGGTLMYFIDPEEDV